MSALHDCSTAPLLCTCPRDLCVAARRQAALRRASVALARAQDCKDGYVLELFVEDAILALYEAGSPALARRIEEDDELLAVEQAIDAMLAASNDP